jgi:nitroreductase
MEALDLLLRRRSVSARNMTNPGPTAEQVETLLTAATRVPDHGKLAPWRFVLFEGEARAEAGERLAAILAARGGPPERIEQTRVALARAPLVVAVISRAAEHPKIPVWEQQMSAGAVCMNLCLAAHALGFAANWLSDWFAFDEEAKAALGVAPHEAVAGFVYVGTPTETPPDRPRPALADVVTRWEA